jgi:hypothetical protein
MGLEKFPIFFIFPQSFLSHFSWFLILREEYRLMAFESRMLRRIFELK